MKKFILLVLLVSLSTSLFAKTHEGSFKLMEFRDGSKNSFDADIKVKYQISTLMGEPVVKVHAKYTVGEFVDIEGKSYVANKLSSERITKLKIYDLKLKVPFETSAIHKRLYIDMDMGAMKKPGEWSYNTPGSPNWDKWIMDGSGFYLSKEEAIKAYKGFQRLGNDGVVSLAKVTSIKYNVSGAKEKKKVLKDVWVDEETGLIWQNEKYTKSEEKAFNKNHTNYQKVGNFVYAKGYCNKLILNNFKDWRLPSQRELKYLWDKNRDRIIYAKHSYMFYNEDSNKIGNIVFINGNKYDDDAYVFIRCVRSVK